MPMKKPRIPFLGTQFAGSAQGFDAAIFAAPHGTPYRGIDNRVHAASGKAIREALAGDGEFAQSWDFDFDAPPRGRKGFRVADLGDLGTKPQDGSGNRKLIGTLTRTILKAGAVPLMIGGDDSVPIPFIEAFDELGPITILQIDAHIDWRDERLGEKLGFSNTMRRASEMTHVKGIVQVGARGIGSARESEVRDARAWDARLITARVIHSQGIATALEHIPSDANCLITLDLDALDSATMPAVAYPTPGGLTYTQVTGLIHGVARKARIVGFDMIEFIPKRDVNGLAAFTAGRILWNVIGALANSLPSRRPSP
jgi:agmatinase